MDSAATHSSTVSKLALDFAARTETGRVRTRNQDAVLALGAGDLPAGLDALFIVADGMSGFAGGEIASSITVETIESMVREAVDADPASLDPASLREVLCAAIHQANAAVRRQAEADPSVKGMATTVVVAAAAGGSLVTGCVGDSRGTLYRDGAALPVTAEHVLFQAMGSKGGFSSVVTRGVGMAATVEADFDVTDLADGDVLLLCTDGLTDMVKDVETAKRAGSGRPAREICDTLVETALRNGGRDNVTVVVARFGAARAFAARAQSPAAPAEERGQRAAPRRRPRVAVGALLSYLFVLACLAAGGLLFFLNNERYRIDTAWPFIHEQAPKPVRLLPPAGEAPPRD
jgi:protein phosphatase